MPVPPGEQTATGTTASINGLKSISSETSQPRQSILHDSGVRTDYKSIEDQIGYLAS